MKVRKKGFMTLLACAAGLAAQGFEGRIEAVQVRGNQAQYFVWQVGTNRLCIARTETDQPEARNLVALDTGEITLVFPQSSSYVRYRPEKTGQTPAGFPEMPMPPGGLPSGIGPSGFSGMPQLPTDPAMNMPAMPAGMPTFPAPTPIIPPAMPEMPEGMEMPTEGAKRTLRRGEVEFIATGETTNLLGRACTRYEIRDRRRVMEVWATDQLVPFHSWQPSVPPRNVTGRRSVEENWAELLQEKSLFPLLATLKNEQGEAILFEYKVTAITPGKIEDESIFHPPVDYQEMHAPSF